MDSNTLSTGLSIGALIIGLILILTLIRTLVRLGDELAIVAIFIKAIGDLFGSSRLALLGCAVVGLICLGCTGAAVLSVVALSTCGTANPVQLCRLVGR